MISLSILEQIEETLKNNIMPLPLGQKINTVYLFGSILGGKFNDSSDLDVGILVRENQKLELDDLSKIYIILSEKFNRTIDLVVLDSRRDILLVKEILSSGRIIIDVDPSYSKLFVYKFLQHYHDFRPKIDYFNRIMQLKYKK